MSILLLLLVMVGAGGLDSLKPLQDKEKKISKTS